MCAYNKKKIKTIKLQKKMFKQNKEKIKLKVRPKGLTAAAKNGNLYQSNRERKHAMDSNK